MPNIYTGVETWPLGTDLRIEAKNLFDHDAKVLLPNTATVTATFKDTDDVSVTGAPSVGFAYVSPGFFKGTLTLNGATMTAGTSYVLELTVTNAAGDKTIIRTTKVAQYDTQT